jgi:phosphoglycolate phosphatase-like HAD superfamily hydrolase
VKTEAFVRLFEPFGAAIAARVREHHEIHGGMSRFEKLPLYLGWASRSASPDDVSAYCAMFSSAVFQAVVESAWVPGAREYLEANYRRQRFVLVTATPQDEIEEILSTLDIAQCFCEVHGAPTAKSAAIEGSLARFGCLRSEALVIGDSPSDLAAAAAAQVEFLLRCTPLNARLQETYSGLKCQDFTHE